MKCSRFAIVGVAAAVLAAGSVAMAQAQQPAKNKKPAGTKAPQGQAPQSQAPAPAGQPQAPALPPGWSEADMQACAMAAVPGEMQAHLTEGIGVWTGRNTMWMAPGMEPTQSSCTATVTAFLDGRFTKCEMSGDMPGMGPFNGFGLYGFDNVAQQFQGTWIDNCGTGMMFGKGELSSDRTTMTWTMTYNCPIRKKAVTMREVDRITGKDTRTMELYATDPKSGQEFKMMEVAFTRTSGGPQASAASITNRKVEAGCASCVYHMAGVKSCTLAVNLDGKTYLVKGADKVDAHQFCDAPRQVVVSGGLRGEWFVATAFDVQPAKR